MNRFIPKLFIYLTFSLQLLEAQIVPSARTVNWSNAGYRGSIPTPSQVVDVTSFGALGDGVTDDHAAIISAKNSLTGLGVLYFPPGNYKVGNEINLPGNIILRGAGADSSRISFDLGGGVQNCINIVAAQSGNFFPAITGYSKESTVIVVDSITHFSAGGYCEILQDNGSWDTHPAIWAEQSVGQIFKIISISGDTLHIDRELRISYDSLLNPRLRMVTPASNVGLECIAISRVDDPMGNAGYNISCSYAINVWFHGFESHKSAGAHLLALRCSNMSIKGSYFHDAYEFTGSGTKGYGVVLAEHSGECLVENNIFRRLRHAMMVKQGANGNVFAYNYCREPLRPEFPSDAAADLSLHGHYAYANLFEGNIVQNLFIDQAWGASGPDNLFFRNRAELYGIVMSSGTVESDNQIFVGNEVPNTGALLGNYILSGTGHFEYANNIQGSAVPPGTGMLNDDSYYLSAAPPFWNIPFNWPSIGYPNMLDSGDIPSKLRFTGGSSNTVCEDLISSVETADGEPELEVYPNPSNGDINFNAQNIDGISLYDLSGRKVDCWHADLKNGTMRIENAGFFILELLVNGKSSTHRVLIF